MSVLVVAALKQQAAGGLSHQHQQELLLFLLRNRARIKQRGKRLLQDRLQLRSAAGDGEGYSLASSLVMPLTATSIVPAELEPDLVLAGVCFLHPQYQQLWSTARAGIELCWWLQELGCIDLSVDAAVHRLLRLYRRSYMCQLPGSISITQQQHMRHVKFMLQSQRAITADTRASLSRLRLYPEHQDPVAEGQPSARPNQLHWPLSGGAAAAAIKLHLGAAGCQFLHCCYSAAAGVDSSLWQEFLIKVAGVEPSGPDEVVAKLLSHHRATTNLQGLANTLGLQLEQLLLQQLDFLASVRSQLTDQTRIKCSNSFMLLSSSGQLLAGSRLHLPPMDAAAVELLADLTRGSGGLQLLSAAFQPIWSDYEQKLVLTQLLKVKQADAAAIVAALADLHSSSSSIGDDRRQKHLAYLARHLDVLEQDHALLERVRQAVKLPDAAGRLRPASTLHLPLQQQFISLQADMDAAGMLFLHSSYTASSSSCASSSRRMADLLRLLGVSTPDVSKVAAFILELYKQQHSPGTDSHLLHVQFLHENWHSISSSMQADVRLQLRLLVVPASSSAVSFAAPSSLFELPAESSAEAQLLSTLQLGGASFLHTLYARQGIGSSDLLLWLKRQLKVKELTTTDAVQLILAAHDRADQLTASHTLEQIAQHAWYLALSCQMMSGQQAKGFRMKQRLLLALQPVEGSSSVVYRTARSSSYSDSLFWPEKGEGWELQQVLLPSEVQYIHPVYAQLVAAEGSDAAARVTTNKVKRFFTQQLGVLAFPPPGSEALDKAIAEGNCWRQLLLLLRDTWSACPPQVQEAMIGCLRDMQVGTTNGQTKLLRECFLETEVISSHLSSLMKQLQLPFLDVPAPHSPRWHFLQQPGVSTALAWPDLLKVLTQLSSAAAVPSLHSMQQLYDQVFGLARLNSKTADSVRDAFARQPLIFVPGPQGNGSGVTSTDSRVLWRGNPRIFPCKVFISKHYKEQEAFFFKDLGVRSASIDDLQDALLELSNLPAAGITNREAETVLMVYKQLAQHSSKLSWLPGLMSKQRVLLVRTGSQRRFAAASDGSSSSSSRVYLPDDPGLVELFQKECLLLDVPTEELPALQPLLQCITPALPGLVSSVQRSYTVAAGTTGSQEGQAGELHDHWTAVMQEAVPLLARCLYKQDAQQYMQLLSSGRLQQLQGRMPVYDMPGLTETLVLGSVSKHQPSYAAVQDVEDVEGMQVTTMFMVNSSGGNVCSLVLHVADKLAELLSSGKTALAQGLAGKARSILRALYLGGGLEEAEDELSHDHVGQIPADKLPSWLGAGEDGNGGTSASAASAASKPLWEVQDEDETADTASSEATERRQAAVLADVADMARKQQAREEAATAAAAAEAAAAVAATVSSTAVLPLLDAAVATPAQPEQAAASALSSSSSAAKCSAASRRPTTWHMMHQASRSYQHRQSFSRTARMDRTGGVTLSIPTAPGMDLQEQLDSMRRAAAAVSNSFDLQQLVQGTAREPPAAAVHSYSRFVFSPPTSSSSSSSNSSSSSSSAFAGAAAPAGAAECGTAGSELALVPHRQESNTVPVSISSEVRQRAEVTTTVTDTIRFHPAASSSSAGYGPSSNTRRSPFATNMEQAAITGAMGELFLFEVLSTKLPGFDEACWHSSNRRCLNLPVSASEPSYDFLYEDTTGGLSGRPGTQCFIECKATCSDDGSAAFPITTKEWELAQELHAGDGTAMFVIIRVAGVRSGGQPRVTAVLRDPVALLGSRQLRITGDNLVISGFPVLQAGGGGGL